MATWLLVGDASSWAKMRPEARWAFRAADKLARLVQPGDIGIVYITGDAKKKSSIVAAVRFETRVGEVPVKSFFDHVYPLRATIAVLHESVPPVAFAPLVPSLGFITNKLRWGLHLKGQSARRLSADDAEFILSALRGGGATLHETPAIETHASTTARSEAASPE